MPREVDRAMDPKSKILTVIVPACDMERFLPSCLGSLVVPPDLMARLEVVVVNDGSTDATSRIAHGFAARYPDTFVVVDKANGHYGSCVNAGLAVATGTWVKVLDADDSVNPAVFADFVQALATRVPDTVQVVVNDYDVVDDDGHVRFSRSFDFPSGADFPAADLLHTPHPFVTHACTYRRAIFAGLDYRQLEGVAYTDTEWVLVPLLRAHRAFAFHGAVYRYLLGRDGQSMAAENLVKGIWMQFELVLHMAEQFRRLRPGADADVAAAVFARLVGIAGGLYQFVLFGFRGHAVAADLAGFDRRLSAADPELAEAVAGFPLSRRCRWRFVRAYRNHSPVLRLVRPAVRLYIGLSWHAHAACRRLRAGQEGGARG